MQSPSLQLNGFPRNISDRRVYCILHFSKLPFHNPPKFFSRKRQEKFYLCLPQQLTNSNRHKAAVFGWVFHNCLFSTPRKGAMKRSDNSSGRNIVAESARRVVSRGRGQNFWVARSRLLEILPINSPPSRSAARLKWARDPRGRGRWHWRVKRGYDNTFRGFTANR